MQRGTQVFVTTEVQKLPLQPTPKQHPNQTTTNHPKSKSHPPTNWPQRPPRPKAKAHAQRLPYARGQHHARRQRHAQRHTTPNGNTNAQRQQHVKSTGQIQVHLAQGCPGGSCGKGNKRVFFLLLRFRNCHCSPLQNNTLAKQPQSIPNIVPPVNHTPKGYHTPKDDTTPEGNKTPWAFNTTLNGARFLSGYNEETQEHARYSNALRLGFAVKDLAIAVRARYIKEGSRGEAAEVDEFLKLKDSEWRAKITSSVLRQRGEQSWKKPKILPLTSDCVKFNNF
ncbi:hypothetical protein HOLleu_03306 [Holothuria leucospilota]|uniref:Uncharacterized protein n=1 Tax=Holothuria leucospilota TaxID=206669 RepID=A0A9Q1CSE8_HOLLE|nr:hypothetical protein HOLleu_03306 [Holothuria leucospilota]